MRQFSDHLLNIGNGSLAPLYTVPPVHRSVTQSIDDLILSVFGDLANDPTTRTRDALHGKSILSVLNKDTSSLNQRILNKLPGQEYTYLSTDTAVLDPADNIIYPVNYINTLNPTDIPSHSLSLKVGAVIMLIRNLNAIQGLANGTRLMVKSCKRNLIQATILTGRQVGTDVLIPRIDLLYQEALSFRRRQFPVRLAFSMTVNKSQGQTLQRVGVYLPTPVFAHGQLYVACSRVGNPAALTIMATHPTPSDDHGVPVPYATRNVVYRRALV
jgi:hypothetical protein